MAVYTKNSTPDIIIFCTNLGYAVEKQQSRSKHMVDLFVRRFKSADELDSRVISQQGIDNYVTGIDDVAFIL